MKNLINKLLFNIPLLITSFLLSSIIPCFASANENSPTIFVCEEEAIFITDSNLSKRRPNIMLFTCCYGAGHKMATQGIIESLPDCSIQVVDIYDVPLRSLDPMKSILPQFSNEQVYNDLAKNEHYRLLNCIGKIAPKALLWQRKQVEDLLSSYISQHKPDMLISCIPLVNSMLLNVAKQFDIPLLVITTDIDISAFCYGFDDQCLTENKKKFRMTVPYAEECWKEKFGKNYSQPLEHSFQYSFGYPTRRAFSESFQESTYEQLRLEYDVKSDEHLILVMMGGNAAQAAKVYGKLLLGMSYEEIDQIIGSRSNRDKIHLICLCGDTSQKANLALMEQLNRLNKTNDKQHNRVRIHACPGTTKIAELVSLPELRTVISKPGGSTVNEMIKKKIPMVYHISGIPLDWERGNMEYGEANSLGKRFQISEKTDTKSRKKLAEVLTFTFALHQKMRTDGDSVPEARIDFTYNLRTAVRETLNTN